MDLTLLLKKNVTQLPLLIDFLIFISYTNGVMPFSSYKFNEMVLQLLFSLDMGDCLEGDLIPFFMRELSVSRKTVRAAYSHAKNIFVSRLRLDERIAAVSKEYELERIGRVERNVLRFALYEMQTQNAQSREKNISEALRLTRKFSTKEAMAYVNALLDEASDETRPPFFFPKTETVE